MSTHRTRTYPDERAGPFPVPPATVEDGAGRRIEIVAVEAGAREALVEMYARFDPADRAQGIPPTGERRIREWLAPLLSDGVNVVARHGDAVVGHATLVPDVEDDEFDPGEVEWELAIFVLQEYQRAGIGTALLEHLLGRAGEVGIEYVWLTVERWNRPAISLYERVGFEQSGVESFEQEMAIRLR